MNKSPNILLIAFLLLNSLAAKGYEIKPTAFEAVKPAKIDQCETAELQYVNVLGDVVKTKKVDLCFDVDNGIFVSKSCQTQCPLLTLAQTHTKNLKSTGGATPGSLLCTDIGGNFVKLFIATKKQRQLVSLCELKEDFSEVNYLYSKKPKAAPAK